MDKYLYNRLIKLIAPKNPMEFEFSVPYDYNISGVRFPKETDEQFNGIINFNFGADKGLKKIINYLL